MSDLHRHKIEGGYIEHQHKYGNPSYKDKFKWQTHTHIVVLGERNYINEFSGPAEWEWGANLDYGKGYTAAEAELGRQVGDIEDVDSAAICDAFVDAAVKGET